MSSTSSAVTYTSVYTDSEPGRVFWGADEEISDRGSPRVIVLGYDGLPIQPVAPPSPNYIPGLEEQRHTNVGVMRMRRGGGGTLRQRFRGLLSIGLLPTTSPPISLSPPSAGERLARYEVGESSTARPIGGRGVDPAEAVPEIAPMIVEEVNTRVTELAELHEHDTQDLYALLEDAQDSRTRIAQRVTMDSQRVDLPIGDRMTLQEMFLRNSLQWRGQPSSPRGDNEGTCNLGRPYFYADSEVSTLNFNGTEGVVGLTRWIKKMESIFNINGYGIENQVKFATCTLLGAALTWWNGQMITLGPKAYSITWEVLKKKMTDKYYPQGVIKKLEIELWNLKVKWNDVLTYTEHFQELTPICTKFVANETEKVDKYINRLPDNIYGNVKSARPKTLDETIELASDLMDQKLRTYTERQSDNKRKADDSSRNNHGHQQQPFKRQDVAKVYNMGT
ncbi:putative reverse transcriptase domain-containing protein, partial [Tanacetum coccineum]